MMNLKINKDETRNLKYFISWFRLKLSPVTLKQIDDLFREHEVSFQDPELNISVQIPWPCRLAGAPVIQFLNLFSSNWKKFESETDHLQLFTSLYKPIQACWRQNVIYRMRTGAHHQPSALWCLQNTTWGFTAKRNLRRFFPETLPCCWCPPCPSSPLWSPGLCSSVCRSSELQSMSSNHQ